MGTPHTGIVLTIPNNQTASLRLLPIYAKQIGNAKGNGSCNCHDIHERNEMVKLTNHDLAAYVLAREGNGEMSIS